MVGVGEGGHSISISTLSESKNISSDTTASRLSVKFPAGFPRPRPLPRAGRGAGMGLAIGAGTG